MIFKEISPFVIIFTLIISSILALSLNKKNLYSIDGIFSIAGFFLGLFITFLNLRYSNNYLISLGPILAITCLSYFKLKDNISLETTSFEVDEKKSRMLNILYWVFIFLSLFSYQQAPLYNRNISFFIFCSLNITIIVTEIFCLKTFDKLKIYYIGFKILFLSLILRASAYFITPFPVGSDPWGHSDYIKDIIHYGTINVPTTFTSQYYVHYPLTHIYSSVVSLIGNLDAKESLFFIGIVLTLSSIFIYLFAKNITNNVNIALFSMLLINFADINMQWSIEIIAMSFGIAIYTILLYLLTTKSEEHKIFYNFLIVLYVFIITWTHTISLFITLLSLVSLFLGSLIYNIMYKEKIFEKVLVNWTLITFVTLMMLSHWLNPDYPFFNMVVRGLIESLNSEVNFLGKLTSTNIEDSWHSVIDIFGFLSSILFGIIGTLYFLSNKYTNRKIYSLIFMITTLFFVFFIFPVMGLKNIIPGRWPPFIYMSFIIFVGFGFFICVSILKNKNQKNIFILISIFTISFLNITSSISNMDSPFLNEKYVSEFIWTESEMKLCEGTNNFYNGTITTDIQTAFGPLETYYKNNNTKYFRYDLNGEIDYDYMYDTLVIWRRMSISRPVTFDTRPRRSAVFLGAEFKDSIDRDYSNIYDTGGAKAYLNLSKLTR